MGWRRLGPLTLRDLSDRWQLEGGNTKAIEPGNRLRYKSIVARLNEHYDGVLVRDLRPRDVSGYATKKLDDLSAASVSRDLSILPSVSRGRWSSSSSTAPSPMGSHTHVPETIVF